MAFGDELKKLRLSVNASFADIDRGLGKSNYAARVERGELPAPNRATALELGEALRGMGADTDGERLWLVAAPEFSDPDVRAYFERLLEDLQRRLDLAQPDLSDLERDLIALTRAAQAHIPKHGVTGIAVGTLIGPMTEVLEALFEDHDPGQGIHPVFQAAAVFTALSFLPPLVQHRLWLAFGPMVRAAAYPRDDPT